jgi:hypothetical protein
MRLINTKDLSFEEYLNPHDCSYAIISHRWTDEEVSYEEYPLFRSGERSGYGWTKILEACRLARLENLDWVWIDTCCIDKVSYLHCEQALFLLRDMRTEVQCRAFGSDQLNV